MSSKFATYGKHAIKFCTHVIKGSLHVPKLYSDVPENICLFFSKPRFKKRVDAENFQL
jgi:hypothetical protein